MASLVSCTAVPHPWFSDLPLKINYKETLLQGKIEIIWLCININKKDFFFSVYRRNNYVLHKIIVQRHFWQKYFFPGATQPSRKITESPGGREDDKYPLERKFQGSGSLKQNCPPWRGFGYFLELHNQNFFLLKAAMTISRTHLKLWLFSTIVDNSGLSRFFLQ